METGRAEAFSDGVFAIAITPLIQAVGIDQALAKGDLKHQLLRLWPAYIAYTVSFLTIGVMWTRNEPSALNMRSRTASGRGAVRRPV
jgi:TMEM175 potassium channel family protein